MKSETKRDKFVRLAEARTNKVISMIRLLGNCSNTRIYEYDKKDVQKIFSTIEDELKAAKLKYELSDTEDKLAIVLSNLLNSINLGTIFVFI